MLEKLLAALKAQRPDLYVTIEAKVTGGTITEDEVATLLASAITPPHATAEMLAQISASVKQIVGDTVSATAGQDALKEVKILAAGLALTDELKSSGLPEISQAKLKKQFEGQVFETEILRAAIKDEKEYLDKITGSGAVTGSGHTRVGTEEPEKIQAAFDKLFGVEVDDKFKDIPAMTSLRAAYAHLTGDADVSGRISPDALKFGTAFMEMMRLPAAYSSSSFSYVLGNTLYRRLVQDYKAIDFNEQALISYKRNAKDFKTMESVRIGYFGDLPDVDPESADYAEITMVTDEEVSYALNQKGAILSVTRKTIINDDLKSVQTIVSRVGRSARRTFARRGWNKIINNATYKADNIALFHAVSHGNLGAVALTNDATGIATLTARLVAMYAQTEKDSGEALALEPKYLWVPRAVLETAKALNSPWPIAGTVNPHAGLFGTNHERIIVNKLATDANDWGMIADPSDVELLEVAFFNGHENPELFVADNPLVGQMFVGDKVQYKMRHEYEWEIADTRGFDKSVI